MPVLKVTVSVDPSPSRAVRGDVIFLGRTIGAACKAA